MNNQNYIVDWLISEGRLLSDGTKIVEEYCARLVDAGLSLSRVRIGQSYANPLISAWGVIWTPDETRRYSIPSQVLNTSAWKGSPFEYIISSKQSLRKKISNLDLDAEHEIYRELSNSGATDFYAMPLEYGDKTVQGTSFVTNDPSGFSEVQIALIESTRDALAAALEPVAAHESLRSLLRTYLGEGAAREIRRGRIKRGEHQNVLAAVLVADMRGFTAKSDTWPETQLLDVLGDYFEMIVDAVRRNGGDVLKFMGDGVLATFNDQQGEDRACMAAVASASEALIALDEYNKTRQADGKEQIEFVIGIDYGNVTLGNIGSPDRLDFTVLGKAVNIASRVQGLCKALGKSSLVTKDVADHIPSGLQSVGPQSIKSLTEKIELFEIK